jgi:hypothetical protein
MNSVRGKQIVLAAALLVVVAALGSPPAWSASSEEDLAPGTVINMQNWQNYKQYMPDGMQEMFKGTYFWKFPADFQIVIGPPHHVIPPRASWTTPRRTAARLSS